MVRPTFRSEVLDARERLAEGRDKLRQRHDSGSPGIQVSACLTSLIDDIVMDLYRAAIADHGSHLEDRVALVPHGGYGRRDMAPFSDVDLMLLHSADSEDLVQPLAQRISQDICDSGLHLGFSLRTLPEACSLAGEDAKTFTSVAESRLLVGSEALFQKFLDRLRRGTRRRFRPLVASIEVSRREERNKYGDTNFLLMPNIKRSSGGLRDIQLVRWIGFACYGERDPAMLTAMDAITAEDHRCLRDALEYLLRLRNELHFHAGRVQDVLDRDEQVRLAHLDGYEGSEGLLPVEQYMRVYFQHTGGVRNAVTHFVAGAKNQQRIVALFNSLASHRVGRDFRVGPLYITATKRGLRRVQSDLSEVLRLMDLANRYEKFIDHQTWKTIRQSLMARPPGPLDQEVTDRFLSLMSQPGRLGDLLRRLHEVGVLEQLIPGMSHARCLLQFNEFHKYTVDEHSIRAVEEATKMADDPGPLGQVYRSLKNKRTLHLALLVHDLGKGCAEDHSEVGARLALETAARLNLPNQEAEAMRFLVHKHLLLSHLAQFRDINDPNVVVDFAVQVGSPENLKMLYVMTGADLAAVGSGFLNEWRLNLFTQLYRNAYRHLAGEPAFGDSSSGEMQRRAAIRGLVPESDRDSWWDRQIDELPPSCLWQTPPEELVQDLARLRPLEHDDAIAWGRYLPDRLVVEYTVGTYERITPGIFHRLTGVLSSQRMEIFSAEIHTLADGLVLDRFYVQDRDFEAAPDENRVDDVARRLVAALKSPTDAPPRFPAIWGSKSRQESVERHAPPTQVRVDNNTSDRYTIVDVFAIDRLGLLYTISRKLFELGLSVHIAKIGTHLDQVVDVFYVTDDQDRKIRDAEQIERIREALLERILEFEREAIA